MAVLAPAGAALPGAALSLVAPTTPGATPSDHVAYTPGLALLVRNSGGGAVNFVVGTPAHKDVYGVAVGDITVSLAASEIRLMAMPADLADNTGLIAIGGATGITYRPVVI